MQNVIIRPANHNDIVDLVKMEQGVIIAEQPFDPTLKENAVYYNFSEMLVAPHIKIFVAQLEDGNLIASGFARIEEAAPYLKHDRYAYLAYMYVAPEYRRQGVNKKIIDALVNWGRNEGVREFRLKVYTENSGAIDAYKKAGFEPLALEMRMDI